MTGPVRRLPTALYDNRPEFEDKSYAAFGQIDWKFADT